MAYPLPANLPDEFVFNVAFDVRRPFTSTSSPIDEGSGTLLDAFPCGAQRGSSGGVYTHILICNPNINIVDGCSRLATGQSFQYTDGDQVRVYTYFGYIKFVVVWVAYIPSGSVGQSEFSGYKVVYLHRDANVIV